MNQISVSQLAAWLADTDRKPPLVLDVREAWEVQTATIPGAVHIPMREIPSRVTELEGGAEIVAMCHHGSRSMQVAMFLEQRGLPAINLAGGIDAWSREIDPGVPRY